MFRIRDTDPDPDPEHWITDPEPRPALSFIDFQDANKKNLFSTFFLLFCLLPTYHESSNLRDHKEVKSLQKSSFSLFFCP